MQCHTMHHLTLAACLFIPWKAITRPYIHNTRSSFLSFRWQIEKQIINVILCVHNIYDFNKKRCWFLIQFTVMKLFGKLEFGFVSFIYVAFDCLITILKLIVIDSMCCYLGFVLCLIISDDFKRNVAAVLRMIV